MNEIAANIKALRKEKGLSQEQFAQALHVTRQTVSAWERVLSRPGLETLEQMAGVLEVEAEVLLYGREKGKKDRYRRVSFWPVLGVLPLFLVMVFYVIPLPMSLLVGTFTDTAILLCGQMFLAMLVMFVYCALKDEIRNRDYCEKHSPEEWDEPQDEE